jgi:hypothetical protein
MTMNKNAAFGTVTEKTFGFLTVTKTSFPNDTHLFQLRLKGHDDAPPLAITARPHEVAAEFRRITEWIESQ